jgi:hypothetical protein
MKRILKFTRKKILEIDEEIFNASIVAIYSDKFTAISTVFLEQSYPVITLSTERLVSILSDSFLLQSNNRFEVLSNE